MVSSGYKPWQHVMRCASCGQHRTLTENGICADCEHQHNRGHQAAAPAFQPVTSERAAARPDGRAPSFGSWPTIESAGSADFARLSRDTW